MGGVKFRFAFSNDGSEDQRLSFSGGNGAMAFAFEFESTSDDTIYLNNASDVSMLAHRSSVPRLCSGEASRGKGKITWHANRRSKFKDRISFYIDGQTKLEFLNGERRVNLYWERGGVSELNKDDIESLVLLGAKHGRLGMLQCTIYENILEYGAGPEILRTYIDETCPMNDDINEIAELLTEAGFEVICD